jgi:hypothetical protein
MLSEIVDNSLTDKNTLHSYLDLYYSLLHKKKYTAQNILEIGIHIGGSIKLWYDFFPNAKIYGLDSQMCTDHILFPNMLKNNERVVLFTNTDAYKEDVIDKNITSKNIKFDFMIDDGPHTLESQQNFIRYYSKFLKDDGILVIEDVQTMEWIPKLESVVPENLKKFITIYDLHLCTFKTPIIYTFFWGFYEFYFLEHIFHFYYKHQPKCSYNILLV